MTMSSSLVGDALGPSTCEPCQQSAVAATVSDTLLITGAYRGLWPLFSSREEQQLMLVSRPAAGLL